MMQPWEPVAEEYKAAFENYKITFDHEATLSKFYTGTVVLMLGALSAQVLAGDVDRLRAHRGLVLVALFMLLLVGMLSTVVLARIANARFACIRRMNYLRRLLLGSVEGFDLREYLEVCGFPPEPRASSNWSVLSHASFLLTLCLFVIAMIVWVALL